MKRSIGVSTVILALFYLSGCGGGGNSEIPIDDNKDTNKSGNSDFQKQYELSVAGFVEEGITIDDDAVESGKSFVNGSEYYISTSGSSTNSGKSENTPWDLATFNAHKNRAGGDVYLFKRGDEFRDLIQAL